MGDFSQFPGGHGGLLGAAVAACAAAAFWLRRLWGKDSVGRQTDGANHDVIAMLREQVGLERARADQAVAALGEAVAQINKLREQVLGLSEEIRMLQLQLTAYERSKEAGT